MKTKITELLGIKYPIIQGGMAWTSDANLAAAVSNAGGAGIIATGGRTVEWTRDEIRKAKDLTAKPFGVNIMLMAPNIAEIIDVVCEEKVAFVTLGAGNPVPHIEKFHAANIHINHKNICVLLFPYFYLQQAILSDRAVPTDTAQSIPAAIHK